MKTEQISIFLENRSGRLAEVIQTLANANINIRALSLADTSDFGILRLICSDLEKTKNLLKEKGFTIGSASVVAVEVPDKPGGLNSVLQLVSREGINVEYMYVYVQYSLEKAIMIFRFDKIEEAINLLKENGFTIIPGSTLCKI